MEKTLEVFGEVGTKGMRFGFWVLEGENLFSVEERGMTLSVGKG